jgi:integrative and conjugative element protein (TIGR02256 family)
MPRSVGELRYPIRGVRKYLIFSAEVLRHFEKHRQRCKGDSEAGGQLFATFAQETIIVVGATGPYSDDRRRRFRFTPHREQEQRDVKKRFALGQHFVGNWHTHPEAHPHPSGTDVRNTRQRFVQSEHELLAFTMVIVGLADFPRGLWVGLVNAEAVTVLQSVQSLGTLGEQSPPSATRKGLGRNGASD